LSVVSYVLDISLRSYRMTPINLLHDPLCPADSIRYGSYGCRNPRPAVVLCQLSGREDRGGDQKHALATFVHARSLALSLYIRHQVQSSKCGRSEIAARNIHADRQVAL